MQRSVTVTPLVRALQSGGGAGRELRPLSGREQQEFLESLIFPAAQTQMLKQLSESRSGSGGAGEGRKLSPCTPGGLEQANAGVEDTETRWALPLWPLGGSAESREPG